MGRARLTPEERRARAKARSAFSFSDAAYQHYDPEKEGFGSPEQWEEIAARLFGKERIEDELHQWRRETSTFQDMSLRTLDLDVLPSTLAGLKSAFRKAMFKAHPDYGGTNQAARAVMTAFSILKRKFV